MQSMIQALDYSNLTFHLAVNPRNSPSFYLLFLFHFILTFFLAGKGGGAKLHKGGKCHISIVFFNYPDHLHSETLDPPQHSGFRA